MPNIQTHSFAVLKVHAIFVLPQTLGKHVVKPPLHNCFVLLIIHKRKIAVLTPDAGTAISITLPGKGAPLCYSEQLLFLNSKYHSAKPEAWGKAILGSLPR